MINKINRIVKPMNDTQTNEATKTIIGCAMKAHSTLGFGFLESVYQNALAHELRKAGCKVDQQVAIKVYYDGIVVGDFFADLIVNDTVILELKTVERLNKMHEVQLVNYLNATGKETGLLLNFGAQSLEFKRKFRSPKSASAGFSGVVGLAAVCLAILLGHF